MSSAPKSLLQGLRARTPDMVEQLAWLVEAESGSEDSEGLGECGARLSELGSRLLGVPPEKVERCGKSHLVWRFGTADRPATVLLVGHFDTVWPAGTTARWPFVTKGDTASGPGAFDMKAGIIQMLHGLSFVQDPDGVTCVLTCDEELGSPTSRSLVEDLARGASAALVCEPSAGGALKLARKGTSMYEIAVQGRASHAGLEPEKGVNATIELAHQILALASIARPDLGTTVTPTVITGGTTTNTVPDHASVRVDVRAATPEEQARVDREMKALRSRLEGTRLVVAGAPNRPPFPSEASRELFATAGKVAAELGLPPLEGVEVGGASDGNFTAGLGVPTLDGLGAVGGNAHAEGEWVKISALAERAALLAGLTGRLLEASLTGQRGQRSS